MPSFAELSSEEQARQLRDPEGAAGLATADALAAINREGNAFIVASLGLAPGDVVLEVGCGLGTMAAEVLEAAAGGEYVGLDLSPTMVDAAKERHRGLIDAGRASFHLGSTEEIPFVDGRFDKLFSAGVIHFWADPVHSLREVRRVMKRGGRLAMGCLAPGAAPSFAKPELGFHLRAPAEWEGLAIAAGFSQVGATLLGGPEGPQMTHLQGRA